MNDALSSSSVQRIHHQALNDLCKRARGGIYIYPAVWFVTTAWGGTLDNNPHFFYTNTVLILLLSFARFGFRYYCLHTPIAAPKQIYHYFEAVLLASALHWGGMTAWLVLIGDFPELRNSYMILAAAFAIGGGATLGISKTLRVLYPLFVFLPSVIVGLVLGGSENYFLMAMMIVALIYISDISSIAHRDYWNAIINQQLAKQRNDQLEQLSQTDPLTGLKNRLFFNSRLEHDVHHCVRNNSPLSVLMIDIDHFKAVNDSYGHDVGDKCLKQIAHCLQQFIVRETDSLVRFGGEEFVILLPATDQQGATLFANKIINACRSSTLAIDNNAINITLSIGITTAIPQSSDQVQPILTAADQALYHAKRSGRNCWQYQEAA